MQQLPEALSPLAAYNQFILYKLVWDETKQKNNKVPINPRTLQAYEKKSDWQRRPEMQTSVAQALYALSLAGPEYGLGFLLTDKDPFFFVDIDDCLDAATQNRSQTALSVLSLFPDAAVEVSQSGTGLHIFGTGICPPHGKKNTSLGLELYTEWRFVALTGANAIGSAATDCSATLPSLVNSYFPISAAQQASEWSDQPAPEWSGPEDDDELIAKALNSKSAGGIFGNKCSFSDLWRANEDALSTAYPDTFANRAYDPSQADAALAQHLAFWTGNNHERMLRLMWQSELVRNKWERDEYLTRTIERATSLQTSFYSDSPSEAGLDIAEKYGAPKLRSNSEAQLKYAESTRALKLLSATDDEAAKLCSSSGANASAKFWLSNQDKTPAELVAMITPLTMAPSTLVSSPEIVSGYQYLSASLQLEYFKDCVYVQDLHRVFTPEGSLLKSEQFNAVYGGYTFQLDDGGDKTTRKAWEAFTESQVIRYPKAISTCFRPELEPGQLIQEEGQTKINTFVPVKTARIEGDPSPFLNHLAKVLPVQSDRDILLAYMAACIQHRGVKFQWTPLLQGTDGNGKTLFTRCVAFALGSRYTHLPPASEINEKFNEWLFNKLFIGIEDVYVPEHKREIIEIIKPMITNDRLAMRAMQQSQVMGDNRANFILNSNHRDAIRKTRNDRRFAVFYTAQQAFEDLARDGLDGSYFPDLYDWLTGTGVYAGYGENFGYAVVAQYLETYQIPNHLNPATGCHRAPDTSSTDAAISASLGSIEQEIIEAIDEGRPGFANGWISSMALDRLLQSLRRGQSIPPNKRRELLQSLGYDWHPALVNGRVNNIIAFDGGKPRLFVRNGHPAASLTNPATVAKAYQDAQVASPQEVSPAAEVFK